VLRFVPAGKHMMLMRAAFGAVCLLSVACGGPSARTGSLPPATSFPTAPSLEDLLSLPPIQDLLSLRQIQDGPRGLFFVGPSLSEDPLLPRCLPFGVPRSGTAVAAGVQVSRDGSDIVVQSASPEIGDLVIRFRATGDVGQGGALITGTVMGWATHSGYGPYGAKDVRGVVSGAVAGAAAVEGVVYSSGYVYGRWRGTIRFIDGGGATGTCSAAVWALE
jgi:hypothetical protein